jgi:hypothetical protein
MAITKYILKKTRRQAAAKVVGTDANSTIITYSDVQYADQAISTANLSWTISDIAYDVQNSAQIVRNGNIVFTMSAGQGLINFASAIGVVLDEQANANVTINTGAGNSSIVLQFTKGAGFNDPDRQLLQQPDR